MQPSPSFDWGRAVTPARWVAGILGGVAFVIWVGFNILKMLGGATISLDAMQYVIWGFLGVGLVLAIVWRGIGEVVGGLALVGGAVGMAVIGGWEIMALEAAAFFAIPGLLFIACGWYALAQRSRHATPTPA